MKSPFPGMDPYLEQCWGDVHTSIATYARDQLQKQLPGDLRARVEEQLLVSTENGHPKTRRVKPDVRVFERRGVKTKGAASAGAVAVAEPLVIRILEEMPAQRSVRIVEAGSGNRLVTAIEILSPWNKVTSEGRKAYRKKQREILDSGASLVEIVLLRVGDYVLYAPEYLLPEDYREPYRICVNRSWKWDEREVYRVSLRDVLPTIRIPLRERDPDSALDLQAVLDQAYANGGYDDLDYTRPPMPPLSGEDAGWADRLLRAKGLRAGRRSKKEK